MNFKFFYFFEGKITDIETPIATLTPSELSRNVRYSIKMDVVQYDELIVTGCDDVLL
jgi:hypothetical protein